MKTRQSTTGPKERTTRHLNASAVALMAIAMGAILTGCIQNYDPRNDSSRIDTNQSHVLAMATE